MKRRDMMEDCPEDFEDRLKEIIDYLEGKFGDIKHELDSITSIGDLDRVNDAYTIVEELTSDLY